MSPMIIAFFLPMLSKYFPMKGEKIKAESRIVDLKCINMALPFGYRLLFIQWGI